MSASPTDLFPMDPALADVYRRGYAIRRRRTAGRLAAAAVVLQLVVALPLAVRQGDDGGGSKVRVVAPASVEDEPTTTEVPVPVVGAEETTTTTVAPTSTTVVVVATTDPAAPGAVYGVIGAGEGGSGGAELHDEHGHTWRQDADAYGNYRFDGVVPGRYSVVLSVESAWVPCTPDGVCIGSAVAMQGNEPFDVHPGEQVRRDFEPYGPTSPATTTTITAPASTTTTTAG